MMKTLIATVVLAMVLSLAPSIANAGTVTLTNPGFETGDQTGWFSWGGWRTVTGDYYKEGSKSLEIEDNDPANTTGAEQDFTVSDPDDFYNTVYTAYVKTCKDSQTFTGTATTYLKWLDSSNSVIGSVSSTGLTGTNDWTQVSINSMAPSGAVKGRISIEVDGSGANVFYDNVSVSYDSAPIPEPTSMLLLGTGLVGLLGFGRKRIK